MESRRPNQKKVVAGNRKGKALAREFFTDERAQPNQVVRPHVLKLSLEPLPKKGAVDFLDVHDVERLCRIIELDLNRAEITVMEDGSVWSL